MNPPNAGTEKGNEPRLGPAGRLAAAFLHSKLTPLLVLASLLLGFLAVQQTPREEEPQIVVPIVDLFVGLPGASPQEVEDRITVPLEKRMWELPGVEYVYSTSMPGQSLVTVRFTVGDDPQRSLVKVYDKVAGGLHLAPPGSTTPLVRLRSIDDVPILTLTLWSERSDGDTLRRIAAELRREVAALPDVSEVGIIGGVPRQLRVQLDPSRLAAARLDAARVAAAIQLQNASLQAGTFEAENREVLVETSAFLRSPEEVAALVVGVDSRGGPIHLRDVATVSEGPADVDHHVFHQETTAGRVSLHPAVTLAIAKRKGADASTVATAVQERVTALQGGLVPADVEVTVTRDYGATAQEKAGELLLHLAVAIFSVTLVIGLALGWRGALVVLISVPVSFALTLFVYYVFGYTLNRVTLFALIFVTGIVVDDSIIVVENIVRHLRSERGDGSAKSLAASALRAVDEVGNPTILATLTVIASVLPMAFVRGLMGPYMRPMPVGASLAMIFSLLVALIAAPWLARRLLRPAREVERGEEDPDEAMAHGWLGRRYRGTLEPLLKKRHRAWGMLAFTGVLLLLSVLLLPLRWVGVKMLPFDNKSEMQVILNMPEGTPLAVTTRAAQEMAAAAATLPEVTDVQLYVGTAAPINFNGLVRHYDLRSGAHVADLQVNLLSKDERSDQSHILAKRLRPRVTAIAERYGATVHVAEVPPGPPVLATLVAEVYGATDEERLALAREVEAIFRDTPGVVDVDLLVEAQQRKEIFQVDREKAALHGVAAAQVARIVRVALAGEDLGLLHRPREVEPLPVHLEVPREAASSVAALERLRVATASGEMVPLSEVTRVETAVREPSLHRKNLRSVVYVTGDVASLSGEGESPVYSILDMAERMETLPGTPELHYRAQPTSTEAPSIKWDGEWQITYEVFRDLGAAFGAVLVLIYLLIVGWFGTFRTPMVMMIAIPLSLVGILPAHWLFGAFFTATSMIGFIALAGIMVRNSVLLIDFMELARRQGRTLEEAVIEAGSVRLRPILLTAGTVVVGAIVILFDPIFEGLAISLMAGAIASTGLTLIVVPVVYYLMESRHIGSPPEDETQRDEVPPETVER